MKYTLTGITVLAATIYSGIPVLAALGGAVFVVCLILAFMKGMSA